VRWGTFTFAILAFVVTLRFITPILQNRWTWAVGTVITSLIMTSGYMFTRIRGMPYTAANGQWIASGHQNQFGQETHVIALICEHRHVLASFHKLSGITDGLLAMSFLMLILVAPLQASSSRQRMQIYLWTGVIMIIYSILLSLFRMKNRGK
jgi:oligosaccharyltransferase complex subunit gamma